MAIDEREQLVKTFYEELYVQHNLAVVYDCLSDKYVCHVNMGPEHVKIDRDVDDLKNTSSMFYYAFPNEKISIDEIKTDVPVAESKRYAAASPTAFHMLAVSRAKS